jgi:hypothetical protein
MKINLFYIALKLKYLEINLIKKVKNLYSINYKTLMEEIKENTSKWKNILCTCIGRISSECSKVFTIQSSIIPIIIQMAYFYRNIKMSLKFTLDQKGFK